MTDDPQPQKIPLIFYCTRTSDEPVREWLKRLDEGGAPASCDRERPSAGTMAVASGHAAVSSTGRWPMGNPDEPADETDGARTDLSTSRALSRAARVHQENTGNIK